MPTIHFTRSGKTVTWDPKCDSILDLAEANGIGIDYCCRCGVDGVCETKLLSGEIEYAEHACWEPAAGHFLPCSTRPKTDLVVEA